MSVYLREENQIGYIEFDQPDSKVNVLNFETLKKFDGLLDQVAQKSNLRALVILSKKRDIFIAGADIREIEMITDSQEGAGKAKAGQDIFNKLEDLKIPTVVVIDGVALGGGCELALACQYRLATFNDKVRIGLPEVNLGILPGFGGTYRLPRLVGLPQGLQLILGAKPVDGAKALKFGLVDRLIPQSGWEKHLQKFLEEILNGKNSSSKYSRHKVQGVAALLEKSRVGQGIIFSQSRKSVLQLTKGFYPSPLKAIEVIQKNFYANRTAGLAIEAKGFGELVITDVCKSLIKVFFVSEKYRKLDLPGSEQIHATSVQKVGVLGAGVMGGGIAQLLADRGIAARLKDISWDAVAKGYQAANKIFSDALKKRRMTPAQVSVAMSRITGTLDYSGFQGLDLVIEAVVEKMEIKKKVFKELSEMTKPGTVLATNTSALSVTVMAKETKDPSKVIGIHFFNPVHRMPLIEVITTPMTSKETIVTTLNLVKRLGKTPILVKDSCGFIVNRILLAYIAEAGRLLEETGEMEGIDKVITDFGMPMGPFLLSDEVGLDVGIKVLHILQEAFGERFKAVEIFEKVLAKGLLGKKSGKGYYIHGKERKPNPQIRELLSHCKKFESLNKKECLDRLTLIMVNEAARCLEEKIVDEPDAIDVGMIFGTGFPPFHGGLLRYADRLGVETVNNSLQQLYEKYKHDRFKPCAYLSELSRRKGKFYKN